MLCARMESLTGVAKYEHRCEALVNLSKDFKMDLDELIIIEGSR